MTHAEHKITGLPKVSEGKQNLRQPREGMESTAGAPGLLTNYWDRAAQPLSTIHCPLSAVHYLLSIIRCPLSTVHCPLPFVCIKNVSSSSREWPSPALPGGENSPALLSWQGTSRSFYMGQGTFSVPGECQEKSSCLKEERCRDDVHPPETETYFLRSQKPLLDR